MDEDWLKEARAWVQEADAVLLVAGAGISYGLGPGDGECWDGHPQQKEGGAMDWARTYSGGETMWGTEGPRLLRTARHWGTFMHAGFPALHKLLEETKAGEYFIFTSNVDHRFHHAGFSPDKIYTPQGDVTLLQCSRPCGGHSWKTLPVCELLCESEMDPSTGGSAKIDASNPNRRFVKRPEDVPTCPRCGAVAYKHTRHNELFTHGPHDDHQARMIAWLEGLHGRHKRQLLVIEVGVGFQTPVVCRWPAEAIVRAFPGHGGNSDAMNQELRAPREQGFPQSRLLRISASPDDAKVPLDLAADRRALGIVGSAETALVALSTQEYDNSATNSPSGMQGRLTLAEGSSATHQGRQRMFAPPEVGWKEYLLRLRDPPGRFSTIREHN